MSLMQPTGTAHFAIGIIVMLLHIVNVSGFFQESPAVVVVVD